MSVYECGVCGYRYDESREDIKWEDLPDDWKCPICDSPTSLFTPVDAEVDKVPSEGTSESGGINIEDYFRPDDENELYMKSIHAIASTGKSIIEPMRSSKPVIGWDDILIKGAQLAKIPLNSDVTVNTKTVIGPNSKQPLELEMPVFVSHMSFGALSREVKIALAKGSAAVKTAMCSGEGGIVPESLENSYRYIFEYVPNLYSVTEENLKNVDAIEIKIGQSAKPGMGGHLPGDKVTDEISEIRGFPKGQDIHSPAHFPDILKKEDLKDKVEWIREKSAGKPVGIKIAAGDIEADLEVILYAKPDFITLDGRTGATGAAPKFVKDTTSVPTVFALHRARKFLDKNGADGISLVITGGLRISPDFVKALALGADAVAIATSALIACGCQQYRVCNSGKCPMGITTQDSDLRKRLDIDQSARQLENFLNVSNEELKTFARLTGNKNVHSIGVENLCTTNSEISNYTDIVHV